MRFYRPHRLNTAHALPALQDGQKYLPTLKSGYPASVDQDHQSLGGILLVMAEPFSSAPEMLGVVNEIGDRFRNLMLGHNIQ